MLILATPRHQAGEIANAILGVVHHEVTAHKPDARAKDTDIRKNTSRNKRLREWLESSRPSLARQACRSEVVTLRLHGLNRAVICPRVPGRHGGLRNDT